MILNSKVYSRSKEYQAALEKGPLGAILAVSRPTDDGHQRCGSWYLATLLEKPSDSIWIDFGQDWKIDSGMLDAVSEACVILAGEHKNEGALL